ncbi:MAG: efflux RND transporter periplasmic adaptor subunit, partial [Pseudomonadales bacterium]|nr:efflux RND transporter periplasmic adaptor subunit [Pseudomonadales bacterium]
MSKYNRAPLFAAITLAMGLTGWEVHASLARVDHTHASNSTVPADPESVLLNNLQMRSIHVEPVVQHKFVPAMSVPAYVDFDQDHTTTVYPAYAGIIDKIAVRVGDHVRRGQLLYTINSPDLVQAASQVLTSHSNLLLAQNSLQRAQAMLRIQASAGKDVEQALADERSAEASYQAARRTLQVMGYSEAQVDHLLQQGKIDKTLEVLSPMTAEVVLRNAAVGTLVQPGTAPAPLTLASLDTIWLVAQVPESGVAQLALGEPVSVTVDAYPGQEFSGKIDRMAAALDPNSHRVEVHAVIANPGHKLLPQMMATVRLQTSAPVTYPDLHESGVVRESDGTISVCVTPGK